MFSINCPFLRFGSRDVARYLYDVSLPQPDCQKAELRPQQRMRQTRHHFRSLFNFIPIPTTGPTAQAGLLVRGNKNVLICFYKT